MPIQFCCTQCGEPIEVDDEHAGQTAACPYCRHMVNIPLESTYDPQAAIEARPARPSGESEPSGTAGADQFQYTAAPGVPGYLDTRRQPARQMGTWALACTGIAVLLMIVYAIGAVMIMMPALGDLTSPKLTEEQASKIEGVLTSHPWMAAASWGSMFFALAGLTLGIVSWVKAPRQNWRAITSVVVCSLFFMCMCFGLVVMVGMGAAGAQ